MEKKNQRITAGIAFIWFFLIILGYYVTHKPINPAQMTILLTHIWKLLLVIWIISIAGGLGKRLLIFENLPSLQRCYLQVSFGLGIISIIVLVIGSLWKINILIILGLLIFSSVVLYKSIFNWVRELISSWKNINLDRSRFQKIIIFILGIIIITQLFVSLAPPIRYDALNYHLTLPKTYLFQEKITDIPWLVMSGMPQLNEMLSIILMGIGGESAVLVFNWAIGLLIILGMVGFLQKWLPLESAWVGVISLFGGYTFASAMSWGYVDLFAAFYGLGTIILLDNFIRRRNKKDLFLVGVFCGLAFGCKYPAGVMFVSIFATLVVYMIQFRNKSMLTSVALFCLGALSSASPWLIKNLLLAGNPIYPFFFASGSMNQIRLDVYQGMAPYGNLLDLFLLPIQATIVGVDGTHGYSVSLGPLLLGLGVVAMLGWQSKPEDHKITIKTAFFVGSVGLLVWAIGNQFSGYLIQSRFYFVLFPTFAVLAAFGYSELSSYKIGQVRIQRIAKVLIVIVLGFNAFQLFSEMVDKEVLPTIMGFKTNQEYLEKNLGWYALTISEIDSSESNEKILFLYEPRGFGCVPRCDPDEILDHWKLNFHQFRSNQEILNSWKQSGFSQILVYTKGMEFLREYEDPHHPEEELDALEALTSELKLIKNYGDWYKLYSLD
jgi:hypothetical protein